MVSATVQRYLDGPASKAPNGTAVNLVNPPHNSTGPLVLLIICTVFTLLATLGREYSRILVIKRLRVEEYLGLLASLSYIVVVYSFLRYWSKVGFFIHMWDLRGADLVEFSYMTITRKIGVCIVFPVGLLVDANFFTSRITDAWRSWTRLRRGSRASNDDGQYDHDDSPRNWVHIHAVGGTGPGSRQRGYGHAGIIDEESLIITDSNKHAMTALEPVAAHYVYSGDSDIVKTVEIDHHVDASGSLAVSHLNLQHPRMKH